MKPKSNKSGLLLCSIITTSAVGVSQMISSSNSAAFNLAAAPVSMEEKSSFEVLKEKIKNGAKTAANKMWEGIKAGANYLYENEKATILSGLFVGSASLFPEATGAVLTGIGKAIKGTAMSTWNLPPGTREIVAMTILIVGSKAYKAWDNWRINKKAEENIEKNKDRLKELRENDIEQANYIRKLASKSEK